MKTSTILLNTPLVFHLPSETVEPNIFENCSLTWEQDALLVVPMAPEQNIKLPALQNKVWLQNCLQRSPVSRVYLAPTLEESVINAWVELCNATQKQVFLRVPSVPDLPQTKRPVLWRVKRLIDWLASAVLLLLLSPLMLLIAVCIRLDSPGPVLFRQWRAGYQGQLFQIYKFRSMQADAEARHHEVMRDKIGLSKLEHDPRVTCIGCWLRKLSLDELPQLMNILRGEMSLVGPRPWAIYDAVRIVPELQGRLNALPGITGSWQVSTRSNELDLYAVTCRDLAYLQRWNVLKDLGILLLTVPRVLFGTVAY